jgi:diguanylate cyclase (GGDEF)-like protein
MGKGNIMALNEELRESFQELVVGSEDWLIRQIIAYAKRQGYTRYTSTLEEAWRISIHQLSETLIEAMSMAQTVTEFDAEETFVDDPISAFAILEAERHRERGIELRMFLGLFKYYRQVYLDLVEGFELEPDQVRATLFFVTRVFDRLEIAFCSAWASYDSEIRFRELQDANRRMTNEKNRFLTVTESLGNPVIHLDRDSRVTYANQAAAPILGFASGSGKFYYNQHESDISVPVWLKELVDQARESRGELQAEHIEPGDQEDRVFIVGLHPMLDVSEKFEGTVVILHDVTALRRAELALEEKARLLELLSHTDPLTGLYNRRGLQTIAEKHMELARRHDRSLTLLYGDVDNLKVINDSFGHAAGDAALVALGSALQRTFRAADIVARVGGDEFVVLLPERSEPVDEAMLDRACQHLAGEMSSIGFDMALTISIGSVIYDPKRHSSFDELLAEADTQMYHKKQMSKGEAAPTLSYRAPGMHSVSN